MQNLEFAELIASFCRLIGSLYVIDIVLSTVPVCSSNMTLTHVYLSSFLTAHFASAPCHGHQRELCHKRVLRPVMSSLIMM